MRKRVKNFTRRWLPLFLTGGFLLLSAWSPRTGKSSWQVHHPAEQLVRLHVLAHSDAPEEQALKYEVVDETRQLFAGGFSPEMAADENMLREYLTAVEKNLRQKFEGVNLRAELTREGFPLRTYGRHVFPAGEYLAVKIIIGEGAGQNWWCLLFPSLCFPPAAKEPAGEIENKVSWWRESKPRLKLLEYLDKFSARYAQKQ